MKIIINIIISTCLITVQLSAQGLIMEDEGMDLVPQRVSVGSKNMDTEIENTYSVSLREYCPTPRNQGEDANCVGWSVGYAAQTIRKAYAEDIKDIKKIDSFAFSPFFIYNNIKLKSCAMGAEIPEALQFLIRTGNVPMTSFEAGRTDCNAIPKNINYEEALSYRIQDFTKLFSPKDSKQKKIKAVKESLIKGYPIVIAMNILESFASMDYGTDQWYSETGSQVPAGGHALVVIGYDELKNSFEVMNSWGDRWADDGFAFIDYDDFHKYVRYGFAFGETEEDPFSIMINFDRNIMITAEGKQYSEKELFRWSKNKYKLASSDYRPNSTYVLKIYHSQEDYKLYCFNASGSGNYKELFRIDGSEKELMTDMKSFGFTLPPLNFTDPSSERFLFLISDGELSSNEIEGIKTTGSVEAATELFQDRVNTENRILSYSRVAMTGDISDNLMLVPIEFENKN